MAYQSSAINHHKLGYVGLISPQPSPGARDTSSTRAGGQVISGKVGRASGMLRLPEEPWEQGWSSDQ